MLVLLRQPLAAAQQSTQAREQDLQLERLRQVIVGAGFESLQHVFGPAARGQHQHRHVVALGAQLLDDGEAVLAGQHHVEHDGVVARSIAEQAIERLLAVAVDLDLVAFGFEVEAQPVGEVRLVFDDQDRTRPARSELPSLRTARLGSSSVNVAPLFSPVLSANTRPPWRLAIDRTM